MDQQEAIFSHHHQILLLLVQHRAYMKIFQALRSPAIPLTSFHDLLVLLISSSIVLRHVLFILPLLLYPSGFQSNAVFSIAPVSLRNVCPIQLHFLIFYLIFYWLLLGDSQQFFAFSLLGYLNNYPVDVSNRLTVHHQEAVYSTRSIWYSSCMYVD